MNGAVLDTGALISFERGERVMVAMVARALELDLRFWVPAGVVGQAWRSGRRQARLAQLLNSALVEVVPLVDARLARPDSSVAPRGPGTSSTRPWCCSRARRAFAPSLPTSMTSPRRSPARAHPAGEAAPFTPSEVEGPLTQRRWRRVAVPRRSGSER